MLFFACYTGEQVCDDCTIDNSNSIWSMCSYDSGVCIRHECLLFSLAVESTVPGELDFFEGEEREAGKERGGSF